VMAAIAYNPNLVSREEAPKTWKDMLDPKWTDAISVKVTISGLQHVEWYMLRQLYGNDFWSQLAPLKPHAFDSYVQQFDRLVNGQDKVALTAQYSGYLMMKAKGAPVEFVIPPDGVVAAPQPWGIVKEAPHPAAAQLFMDWFLSLPGQTGNAEVLLTHSARSDVPPPPGGVSINEFKVLTPTDWHAFEQTHAQFVREWNKITGLR
jgi:iron(III) transport system substrate-binding protein